MRENAESQFDSFPPVGCSVVVLFVFPPLCVEKLSKQKINQRQLKSLWDVQPKQRNREASKPSSTPALVWCNACGFIAFPTFSPGADNELEVQMNGN